MATAIQYIDDYRIRPATLDDVAAVLAVYRADDAAHIGFQPGTEHLLEGHRGADIVLDAWIAETYDGYIIATADVTQSADDGDTAMHVSVDPAYRGRGLEDALRSLVARRADELRQCPREAALGDQPCGPCSTRTDHVIKRVIERGRASRTSATAVSLVCADGCACGVIAPCEAVAHGDVPTGRAVFACPTEKGVCVAFVGRIPVRCTEADHTPRLSRFVAGVVGPRVSFGGKLAA